MLVLLASVGRERAAHVVGFLEAAALVTADIPLVRPGVDQLPIGHSCTSNRHCPTVGLSDPPRFEGQDLAAGLRLVHSLAAMLAARGRRTCARASTYPSNEEES
jgi:hypothetical protein